MKLRANRGQSTHIALVPQGSDPHKFSLLRQVGPESNRQPAVLEHSAHCPDSSKNVQPVCSQFCSQRPHNAEADEQTLYVSD
jgi:hypothetical protein